MIIRLALPFIVLLFACSAKTQPLGGGGALRIGAIYNTNLKEINLENNNIQVRVFALVDTSVNSSVIQEIYDHPLLLDVSYRNKIYPKDNTYSIPGHRLFIVYDYDTMIVDIHGIITIYDETFSMDSIVFKKGYFRFFRNPPLAREQNRDQIRELSRFIQSGITYNTIDTLEKYNYLYYDSIVDLTFLSKEKLPATFYLRRGEFKIQQEDFESAAKDVSKSIIMGLIRKQEEEAWVYLHKAYEESEQYEKAIKVISMALKIHTPCYKRGGDDVAYDYRHMRIELYIKTN